MAAGTAVFGRVYVAVDLVGLLNLVMNWTCMGFGGTYQIMQRSLRRGSPDGVSDIMTVDIRVVPYGQ